MTEYACGFMFDQSGLQMALVQKAKPEWQRGRLNGVGGHVEPGETPLQAMVREFEEETGVRTKPDHWETAVVLTGDDWRVHFFRGRYPSVVGFVSLPDEPVLWCRTDPLPHQVLPNLRWLIPLCLDNDIEFPIYMNDVSTPAVNGATVREAAV